jgi:hypothetical protein
VPGAVELVELALQAAKVLDPAEVDLDVERRLQERLENGLDARLRNASSDRSSMAAPTTAKPGGSSRCLARL